MNSTDDFMTVESADGSDFELGIEFSDYHQQGTLVLELQDSSDNR